jgi:hypothetical protein
LKKRKDTRESFYSEKKYWSQRRAKLPMYGPAKKYRGDKTWEGQIGT